MRRMIMTLCSLLAVLLAAGFAVGTVGSRMTDASYDVMLEETLLFGNRRAADGFTVRLENASQADYPYFRETSGGFLNWDTVYTFGETPQTETDFWFSASITPPAYPYNPSLLLSRLTEEMESSAYVDSIYAELDREAAEAVNGRAERTLFLADFLDFYPLEIRAEVLDGAYDEDASGDGDAAWSSLSAALAEAFTVPIDPSWTVTIGSEASTGEDGSYWHNSSTDYPMIYSKHLITRDAVYIILQPKLMPLRDPFTYDSPVLGLYRLPRDPARIGPETFDAEGLVQLWSATAGMVAAEVRLDPTGERLMLLVHDGKAYSVLEMDPANGDILSEETVGEGPLYTLEDGETPLPELQLGERYAVIRLPDSFFTLLERGEDGRLHVTLRLRHDKDAALFESERPMWITGLGKVLWSTVAHDSHVQPEVWYQYRDGRLAIFSRREMGCGFVIAVYGDGELLYHAQYSSSLDARDLTGSYECYPRVRWTSWDYY